MVRGAKVPISSSTVHHRALQLRDILLKTDPADDFVAKLKSFSASSNWISAFVKRHALLSVRLLGKAGSVSVKDVPAGISTLREQLVECNEEFFFQTGLFFKLFPKTTYVLRSEDSNKLRGTKDMKAKDRLLLYMCTKSNRTRKVPITVIRSAKNSRSFRKGRPPLSYFSQNMLVLMLRHSRNGSILPSFRSCVLKHHKRPFF